MTREGRGEPEQQGLAEEIATVVDPLLADIWAFSWSRNRTTDLSQAEVATLLRMAFLQGYRDALEEDQPGGVLRRLGAEVPAPTPARRASLRKHPR